MPYTVWGGFDKFRSTVVDLELDQVEQARSSRNYLSGQLKALSNKDPSFPRVTENLIPYGSFARGTKVHPINDIDVLMVMHSSGTTEEYLIGMSGERRLRITDYATPLILFEDEDDDYINSNRILYKLRDALKTVPQYARADTHKTMQAVRLNLSSYPWSFDIVPSVAVGNNNNDRIHFLIPDGYGDWIQTDPRRDRTRLSHVRAHSGEKLRPVIRLLKYWNSRTHKPVLDSYYFETVALNIFEQGPPIYDLPDAIAYFFRESYFFRLGCPDPKGLGPALDLALDEETRESVLDAMLGASVQARLALNAEKSGNIKDAFYYWTRVFGPLFPQYEGG